MQKTDIRIHREHWQLETYTFKGALKRLVILQHISATFWTVRVRTSFRKFLSFEQIKKNTDLLI